MAEDSEKLENQRLKELPQRSRGHRPVKVQYRGRPFRRTHLTQKPFLWLQQDLQGRLSRKQRPLIRYQDWISFDQFRNLSDLHVISKKASPHRAVSNLSKLSTKRSSKYLVTCTTLDSHFADTVGPIKMEIFGDKGTTKRETLQFPREKVIIIDDTIMTSQAKLNKHILH